MPLLPIVRYMLPCEDCVIDPGSERRVTIIGLVSSLVALDDPPYPVLCRELCVFLALTEGRGSGEAKLRCTFEESGQIVFESPPRRILWSGGPLEVTMLLFRLTD